MKKSLMASVEQMTLLSAAVILLVMASSCGVKQNANKPKVSNPDSSTARLPTQFHGPYYSSGQKGDKFQSMSSAGCLSTCNHGGVLRMQASVGIPLKFDMNPNGSVQVPSGTHYVPGAYSGTAGVNGSGTGRSTTQGAPNSKKTSLGNRDLKMIQLEQR